MSNTTDEDRKLAEEVVKLIFPSAFDAAKDFMIRGTFHALGDIRALFSSPRQLTEADIEVAAKVRWESCGGNLHPALRWETTAREIREDQVSRLRAAFIAIGLYTPPPEPTPGGKFVEAWMLDSGVTLTATAMAKLAKAYREATAKAIAFCEHIITLAPYADTHLPDRAKSALADLRCEGTNP